MKRLPEHAPFTISLLVLAAVAVASATGLLGGSGPDRARAAELEPFNSCGDLRGYLRDHRWAEQYGPYPAVLRDGGILEGDVAVDAAAAPLASDTSDTSAVGANESGTNVQEEGVDEPDIAKLDGETLLTVRGGSLIATDVSGDDPVRVGSVDLGAPTSGAQMLVAGDRALVIAEDYEDDGPETEYTVKTTMTVVDISDPADLGVVKRMAIDGYGADARLIGDTVRLTLSSDLGYRGYGSDEAPDAGDIESRLPSIEVDGESQPLVGCGDVARPSAFSGLNLLSVVTLDLADDAEVSDAQALVTDGGTVYASPTGLYIATQSLAKADSQRTGSVEGDAIMPSAYSDETAIHRFDTTEPGATVYAASGTVDGRILNSWSLSERDGYLRVATTEGDPWSGGPNESESSVAVLAQSDGELEQIGEVTGLGRGEEIQGVRFAGDMGYVITFKQTDPLYTVDLSSPEDPQLAGELEIPGYSAYLHPVGNGRLLGIGQSGTMDGTLTGAQASLFDVDDASSPQRLDTLSLDRRGYGTASAEWDHRAFLYSPELELAVVPIDSYGPDAFRGALAMRVDPDGTLTRVAEIESDSGRISRSFLVGDRLVTLARDDVESYELSQLAEG